MLKKSLGFVQFPNAANPEILIKIHPQLLALSHAQINMHTYHCIFFSNVGSKNKCQLQCIILSQYIVIHKTITSTVSICLTGLFFWRSLQVRLGPLHISQRTPGEDAGARFITGQMPLLSPNRIKSSEGMLYLKLNGTDRIG